MANWAILGFPLLKKNKYSQIKRKQKFYEVLAESLVEAIEAIFWDKASTADGTNSNATGVWFDYDLVKGGLRRRYFPVNIFPLLLFADHRQGRKQWEANCEAAIKFMKDSGAMEFKGGIPSSMARGSVERWDFPNGEPVGI